MSPVVGSHIINVLAVGDKQECTTSLRKWKSHTHFSSASEKKEENWGLEKCGCPLPALKYDRNEKRNFLDCRAEYTDSIGRTLLSNAIHIYLR